MWAHTASQNLNPESELLDKGQAVHIWPKIRTQGARELYCQNSSDGFLSCFQEDECRGPVSSSIRASLLWCLCQSSGEGKKKKNQLKPSRSDLSSEQAVLQGHPHQFPQAHAPKACRNSKVYADLVASRGMAGPWVFTSSTGGWQRLMHRECGFLVTQETQVPVIGSSSCRLERGER